MANPYLVNGTASPFSIYAAHTLASMAGQGPHKIGTKAQTEDGRVFFWGRNTGSAALAVGQLYVRADTVPNHSELDVTTGEAGSYTITGITIGATALTANQYKDGYCHVTDGAGEGHTYRIRSHAAALASATDVQITLYDAIAVALDTNSTISLQRNGYDTPLISAVDQLDYPVGVPTVTIPAGNVTEQWGWFQTYGEASVLQDETIAAICQALTIGTGVAGAVEEDDTATTVSQEVIVGFNLTATVDTEYSPVFLTIRQ